MTDKEKLDWLRILRTEGIGQITFHKLIAKYQNPSKAIEFLQTLPKYKVPDVSIAERELENAEKFGAKILFSCDENYPFLLSQISDAPAVLYVLGNIDALNRKTVAMVGSRNASINSKVLTEEIARDLVDLDYTVVSGMALGIDTEAHLGALTSEKNKGVQTVAVLAGGVDNIYPSSNAKLYQRIIENGAVISEMPIGTQPQANLFPKRNRIISGLSYGIVVMEASLKSGSLITARFALEQNRDVFAVPNFPKDPRAGGTNMLIKNGATLVENATDIVSVVGNLSKESFEKNDLFSGICEETYSYLPQFNDEEEAKDLSGKILSLLSSTPVSLDSLIRELSGFSQNKIMETLLNLELDDKIAFPSVGKIILKL
ncbi:MAG: DNA-processing protein DprA [bacterium]|nr:DNA-processing protein DprA [bacterium]